MGQYISSNSRSNRIEPQTELYSNRTTELERQESSARTEELTQLREENNILQRQIRAQSTKINKQRRRQRRNLNRLHTRYTDRIAELENTHAEQNNRLQEQDTIQRDRINELERNLRSKPEEKRSLDERLERLQSNQITEEVRTITEERDRLRRNRRTQENRIIELESESRSKTEEIRRLTEERDRLRRNRRTQENRIIELESESRSNTDEIRRLTEQLDNLRRIRRTQENRIIELEIESRSKREQIRRLTEQRDRLRRQRSSNRQLNSDWKINTYDLKIRRNECLGRGGWGAVYPAKFHGCHVAVKEMDENITSTHNRQLFEREAEMASRCRHPCLLQFIGVTSSDRPLIVTEIMEGNLRARLNNQGEPPLSEREITVISLDVASALNYLHNKPEIIIHRDISSSNVLLWRQGDQWRAKLSDYGTVNSQSQSSRNDAGAPIYQAPESVNQEPLTDINIKVSAPAL